ncbi:MAG: methylated-DNA--[protein]-cysteine S-methyltransferase [Verrucomicrobia bacterium]|nr:methylated-DNA--[protein]-cysteine S-methyltransferase [Verrucomicrobiota bacterium]
MGQAAFTRFDVLTPDGTFTAHYSEKGLSRLDFPGSASIQSARAGGLEKETRRQDASAPGSTSRRVALARQATLNAWHRQTEAALKHVLAGRAPVELPPLDVSCGTEFQKRVWLAMKKIKPGNTRSYGEIARSIGKPKAVRAVGGACGANPIPVLIPCHRVLAANRKIGGFSGGLEWKKTLLSREGVNLAG